MMAKLSHLDYNVGQSDAVYVNVYAICLTIEIYLHVGFMKYCLLFLVKVLHARCLLITQR